MSKKKINVEGLEIRVKESNDFLSLTDIAKKEGIGRIELLEIGSETLEHSIFC